MCLSFFFPTLPKKDDAKLEQELRDDAPSLLTSDLYQIELTACLKTGGGSIVVDLIWDPRLSD